MTTPAERKRFLEPFWGYGSAWRAGLRWLLVLLGLASVAPAPTSAWAQGELPLGPKPRETFEDDADRDGIPDGWYNLRDAVVADHGFGPGPGAKCLRFANSRPGRPARASRAFGVDGRAVEAVVIGAWVRAEEIVAGDRLGDDPGLVVDFIGDPIQLRAVRRGSLGPWKTIGRDWTHVRKRLPIPPDTRLAILSMGLIGATGVLEVDDLTIELIPTGGQTTTNLATNGDFELGDPDATGWTLDRGAHRVCPGPDSPAAVELRGQGARAYAGLALPIDSAAGLDVTLSARASGLRGAVGAAALVFFLDDEGQPLPGTRDGVVAIPFAGSFAWGARQGHVDVPANARRALIHVEKSSTYGTLLIDDIRVTTSGSETRWTPYHVAPATTGWTPVAASPEIKLGSALDASTLLDAPAGKDGFVVVRDGRLAFERGGRARFFGVSLLPPTAFLEPERADALLDRLARSGVNLIRLAELETPLGPARSLPDDTRDDTRALDPNALARLDHLVAGAIRRGIYVALELQGGRHLRDGDGIPDGRKLPPGAGPAAAFDPQVRALALATATELLNHINPETGRAWKDEPGLAWVTLAGELTLFDRAEVATREPKGTDDALRTLMRRAEIATTPRGWASVEGAQWAGLAGDLRKVGLHVPIAGSSHFRRDADYNAAQATAGLDLIDDRLYPNPPAWTDPDHRALTWSRENSLIALTRANTKRRADRPYVVGQFADPTFGAWATPYEGVDLLFAAVTAANEDWDALVRRGVFLFPRVWGSGAAGTSGGEDIFSIGEVVNGIPQAFALLPHAAALVRHATTGGTGRAGRPAPGPGTNARSSSGFDPRTNRLVIDTPHTRGLAAWGLPRAVGVLKTDGLTVDVADPSGVVIVSALDREPIATSRRLLVTAVGRVEPTDRRFVDEWRREVGEPGRPPLLHEGVRARVTWRRDGRVRAFALDNTGARVGPARTEADPDGGTRLEIDGRTPSLHWELVVE